MSIDKDAANKAAATPATPRDCLTLVLSEWARRRGYKAAFDLFEGCKPGPYPDVVFAYPEIRFLFVGDVKIATDLPSGESGRKFRNYVKRFSVLLQSYEIDGGRIAVATNSLASADRWHSFLVDVIASELPEKVTGAAPTVKVIESDRHAIHSWIIFCKI